MPSDTLTLGFDCAAPHCAASIVSKGRVIASQRQEMTRGQVEHLMPLIEDLLKQAGISWRDLSAIGVGTGPGNFTGTRIAVAAARGLALGLDVPSIGVSTLEAQAFGIGGTCVSLVPAPRDQVYVETFGPNPTPPRLCAFTDAAPEGLPDSTTCVGHRADELAAQAGWTAVPTPRNVADHIALIAATRRDQVQDRPAPLYLAPTGAAPASDPPPVILP